MSGDIAEENGVPGSVIADAEVIPHTRRFEWVPAYYGLYFVAMAKTARSLGYALGLHGSMARDLDVIAVPWTDEAVPADVLVKTLAESHGLHVSESSPREKPHGRRGYSLMMGGHFYVDLSVMPIREKQPATTTEETP